MSKSEDRTIGFQQHSAFFDLYGPPLRPCPEVIEIMQRHLDLWRQSRRAKGTTNALLLGVTPEIVSGPWAGSVDLTALDVSPGMIHSVWPGDTAQRRAVLGNWLQLPLRDNFIDLVFGDGVFTLLPYPAGYRQLAAALARVMSEGGLFLVRAFCRPATCESVAEVFAAVRAERIGSIHAMKWRLAAAIQGDDPVRGVVLGEVWQVFCEEFPDPAELFRLTDWPAQSLATFSIYKDSKDIYAYPSPEELIALISPWFECVGRDTGRYELAECSPTLSLRCRKA